MKQNTNIIAIGFLIFFLLLTASCSRKKEARALNVIPVASTVGDYSILNLSDFASDIRYIPLETNDSILLGGIYKIICERDKILIGDIYGLSGTGAYSLFDNNGKFLRKIGRHGQGPGEYVQTSDFWMDEHFIYLQDKIKLLIYDFNGQLVETRKLLSEMISEKYTPIHESHSKIISLNKDTFVLDVTSMTETYPKAILLETYQSGMKIIKEYSSHVKIDKVRPALFANEEATLYRFNDEVRTYKIINDTIFTIGQDTEMQDAFIIDFGKYRLPLSYIEGKEGRSDNSIKNFIRLYRFRESLNYLFIQFDFGNHAPEPIEGINVQGNPYSLGDVYGVFDKRTGALALMRQPIKGILGFKNDIDDLLPVFWPKYISPNNEMVTNISAEEFLNYYKKVENPTLQMTEIAKNIKWDDNDIVVVVKLKD